MNLDYIIEQSIKKLFNTPKYYRNFKLLAKAKWSNKLKPLRLAIQKKIVDKTYLSEELVKHFEQVNEDNEPYSISLYEPRQTSQIKKLINSLYHTEQALNLFEQYSESKPNFLYCAHKMLKHTYESMNLATHPDININIILQEQFDVLLPIFHEIQKILPEQETISDYNHPNIGYASKEPTNLAVKIGEIGGTVINQMRPVDTFDFKILTEFSSKLPEYIDKAKLLIASIGAKALEFESSVDKKDIEHLQQEANELIDSITKVQMNSLFNFRNIVHYISIIKRIITISNAVIYQFKSLNTTSHKRVKEWLYQFKYFYIPQILILTDIIEEVLLLRPGVISKPLLISLTNYYDLAIKQLSFVNFEQDILGCEVKSLIDFKFSQIRINGTQNRADECHKNIIIIDQSKIAKTEFYKLLKQNISTNLGEMSLDIKKCLKNYYKLFQKHMVELDPDLDEKIVTLLHQEPRLQSASNISLKLIQIKNFVTQTTTYKDINVNIIEQEEPLKSLIDKDKSTYNFRLLLNDNINVNISKQTKDLIRVDEVNFSSFVLSEYKLDPTFIFISEPKENDNINIYLQLYRDVFNKNKKIDVARKTYKKFISFLDKYHENDMSKFSLVNKQALRNIYQKLQPFMVNFLEKEGLEIDCQLISALNPTFEITDELGRPESQCSFDKRIFLLKTKEKFMAMLNKAGELYEKQLEYYYSHLKLKHLENNSNDDLIVATAPMRRHYLLKSEVASKRLKKIRLQFNIFVSFLNENIHKELIPQKEYVPYPELEDDVQKTYVPAQVLAIKRLENILYYIEDGIKQIENLNDKSYKGTYAYYVSMCGYNFYCAYELLQNLADDPFVNEIKTNIINMLNDFNNQAHALFCNNEPVNMKPNSLPKSNVEQILKPLLDVFYKTPFLVRDFVKNESTQVEIIKNELINSELMRKRVVNLIESPNTWVQALLKLPEVGDILGYLKIELLKSTSEIHDGVCDNLFEIKNYFFVEMLSVADSFENKLGLKAGTITKDFGEILTNIFNGFVSSLELPKLEKFLLLTDPSYIKNRAKHYDLVTIKTKKEVELVNKAFAHINTMKQSIKALQSYLSLPSQKMQAKENLSKDYALMFGQLFMCENSLSRNLTFTRDNLSKVNLAIKLLEEKFVLSKKPTIELSYKLCLDKKNYLESLEKLLLDKYNLDVDSYANNFFNETIKLYVKEVKNTNLVADDYLKSFEAYILNSRQGILTSSTKNQLKINIVIEQDLRKLMQQFNSLYLSDFQCLNKLLVLVTRTRTSLESQLTFANSYAMNIKLDCLNEITKIIYESNKPVEIRISDLKKLFTDRTFQKNFSTPIAHSPFSWAWFVNIFNKFLVFLNIRKSNNHKIIKIVNDYQPYSSLRSPTLFTSFDSSKHKQSQEHNIDMPVFY